MGAFRKTWLGALVATAVFVALMYGCGSERTSFEDRQPAEEPAPEEPFGNPTEDADCGLECRIPQCPSGKTTSIRGVVHNPAGETPIYNAIVYVPSKRLDPFPEGVSCDRCGVVASGDPIVSTLTNVRGEFTLTGVPAGADVPLVIQVGKWRRKLVVPHVEACEDNLIEDHELTRLPRKQSEGDIPLIAVTTGCDPMECLLRKIGIDDAEFTTPFKNGRVHLYKARSGEGVIGSPFAETLWDDVNALKRYDIVLFSCECAFNPDNKSEAAREAVKDYLSAGGRVFGSHYQSYWFREGPDEFKALGDWIPKVETTLASTFDINTSFPKGKALDEWLRVVGAESEPGTIKMSAAQSLGEVDPAHAQRWIYEDKPDGGGIYTKYMSANTPVGKPVEEQCGRIVFTDLHYGASRSDAPTKYFPDLCRIDGAYVPEAEKALEFLFFDLSACVQDDKKIPQPPK